MRGKMREEGKGEGMNKGADKMEPSLSQQFPELLTFFSVIAASIIIMLIVKGVMKDANVQ